MIHNTDSLIKYIEQGNTVKYLFFWGHRKPDTGVSKTCFSQWYDAPFEVDDTLYPTAEHYMMAEKARLFDDQATEAKILKAKHPGEAKKLGRSVHNFQADIWDEHKIDIVIQANHYKFEQDDDLKNFLLNTGQRVLVEASPLDKIWGIGLSADDPNTTQPQHWLGENLLGFALMLVREAFND